MTHLNEEVVIATFHRVGSKMKILDNKKLHQLFCREKPFDKFKMHKHYNMCEALMTVFTTFMHSSSLTWISPDLRYFQISEHLLGDFGKKIYEQFSAEEQTVIDQVASQIKNLNFDYVEHYKGYKWIKVKKFIDDTNLSWEERFSRLERHHCQETEFLIQEIRDLAEKLDKMR